jgi:predicted Zn-ribbon and HTH transcriptional regulator
MNIISHRGEMYSDDGSMTPARRRKIHQDRKRQELYGPELPYKLGVIKPHIGAKNYDCEAECGECGLVFAVTRTTHACECPGCKALWVK